jgi:hypothetical protein
MRNEMLKSTRAFELAAVPFALHTFGPDPCFLSPFDEA